MTKLSYICICFLLVNYAHTNEFSSILNTEVNCEDTLSIVMQDDNRTWIVSQCENPLPLNSAVDSERIIQLTLEQNKIKRLTQKQFQNLPSIKYLKLFENNVRQMDENALKGLKYLKNLTIIEPHLAIEAVHLSKDCKLENLNMRLEMFDSELLLNLPKDIMNLTIEDTPAVNGEISIPDHLINLKYLRYKNCSIATLIEPNAASFTLEYLDLSHNQIEEKTWTWQKYPKLVTLILSYNRITSIDENDFEDLESLKVLFLDNNNIKNVDFNAFRNNLNLTKVDLSNNNLMRIELNNTEFHNYRLLTACNPLSSDSLAGIPYSINTEHIECLKKDQIPTTNSYLLLIGGVSFIVIFIICFCLVMFLICRKRASEVITNPNHAERNDGINVPIQQNPLFLEELNNKIKNSKYKRTDGSANI